MPLYVPKIQQISETRFKMVLIYVLYLLFFKGLNGLLGRDLYINTIFINCITKPFTNLVKYFLEAVAATHATPVDPPLTECKKN